MTYSGRDLLLGGLFVALAVVLPILFHAIGLGGAFLPMFFPIITAGFLLALPVAVTVGLISPLTSALLTGMPPFYPPIAIIMMFEGVILAGGPALLHQKHGWNVWPTLVVIILLDRAALFVGVVLSALWLNIPEEVLGLASLIHSLPGVILIFIIVPPLVRKLREKMQGFIILE